MAIEKYYRVVTRDKRMTPKELFGCEIDYVGNRCGFILKEDALAHGFTVKQWEKFYKRCKTYMKDFLLNGYCETFPISIIYCEETDTYYLGDGQGRRGAMQLIATCGKEIPFEDVPVQVFSTDTFENVHRFIREINKKRATAMSNSDLFDIDAKVVGGDVAEIRAEVVAYRDNVLGLNTEYLPNLMFFGKKCSHKKHSNDYLGKESLRENYETYKNSYAKFVNEVGKKALATSLSETRVNGLVKKEAIGILFESYLCFVERNAKRLGLDAAEKITEATNAIIQYWNSDDSTTEAKKRHLTFSEFFEFAINIDKGAKKDFASAFNLLAITSKLFKKGKLITMTDHDEVIEDFNEWKKHRDDKKPKKVA